MSITHKRLGNYGALESNLCLGTMNFGWHTSEEESNVIMDCALELGIHFFDTADVYGEKHQKLMYGKHLLVHIGNENSSHHYYPKVN